MKRKVWQFSIRGGWEEIDDLIPEGWKDLEETLKAIGYEHAHEYGDHTSPTLQLYQAAEENAYPEWLVVINFTGTWRYIFCPATPDMLELIVKLTPMVNADLAVDTHILIQRRTVIAEDHQSWRKHERQLEDQRQYLRSVREARDNQAQK